MPRLSDPLIHVRYGRRIDWHRFWGTVDQAASDRRTWTHGDDAGARLLRRSAQAHFRAFLRLSEAGK